MGRMVDGDGDGGWGVVTVTLVTTKEGIVVELQRNSTNIALGQWRRFISSYS